MHSKPQPTKQQNYQIELELMTPDYLFAEASQSSEIAMMSIVQIRDGIRRVLCNTQCV